MSDEKVVIVSAKRTAIGSFQGNLEKVKATDLGSKVIEKNINEVSLNPEDIDETIMGCVLPAGLGQAPARQAAIGAGIPASSGATTINKIITEYNQSIHKIKIFNTMFHSFFTLQKHFWSINF